MLKHCILFISILSYSFSFSQVEHLKTKMPSKELIMNAMKDFNWDNTTRANKDEAITIIQWLGGEYQHDDVNNIGDGFVCGRLPSGYHITFWTDTYGKNDRYGIRFGILDNRHSFFGSNDTYFELFKITNPYYPEKFAKRAPTVHLVSVGIGTYQQDHMFNHLEFTVSGAHMIRSLFERRNLTSRGKPLYESAARRSKIIKELESLADSNKVLPEDMIVFYFSGHGLMAGDRIGVCPYDYQSPADLISDDNIIAYLAKSPAKHKVCLIEACRSDKGADYIDPEMVSEFNQKRQNIGSGLVFITSTKVGEKSWGGAEGYFTQALLEALDNGNADFNSDKLVTMQELFSYIQPAVKSKTNNQQIPQINSDYPKELPIMRLSDK